MTTHIILTEDDTSGDTVLLVQRAALPQTISGLPAGSYTVRNTSALVSGTVTAAAVAPTFTTAASISPTAGAVGAIYTVTEGVASGTPAPTLTGVLTLGGVDVTAGMSGLTYTPMTAGALVWTVTASNGVGPAATSSVGATVIAAPTVIGTLPDVTGTVGVEQTITTASVFSAAAALVYSLTTAPPGATIDGGTGVITYTPAVAGGATFVVRATISGQPTIYASAGFSATISAAGYPARPVTDPILLTGASFTNHMDDAFPAVVSALRSGAVIDYEAMHRDSSGFIEMWDNDGVGTTPAGFSAKTALAGGTRRIYLGSDTSGTYGDTDDLNGALKWYNLAAASNDGCYCYLTSLYSPKVGTVTTHAGWEAWRVDNDDLVRVYGHFITRLNLDRRPGSRPIYLIPIPQIYNAIYDAIDAGTAPSDITSMHQFTHQTSLTDKHPSPLGRWVMTLAHYAVVYRASPAGAPLSIMTGAPGAVADTSAAWLADLVWTIVTAMEAECGLLDDWTPPEYAIRGDVLSTLTVYDATDSATDVTVQEVTAGGGTSVTLTGYPQDVVVPTRGDWRIKANNSANWSSSAPVIKKATSSITLVNSLMAKHATAGNTWSLPSGYAEGDLALLIAVGSLSSSTIAWGPSGPQFVDFPNRINAMNNSSDSAIRVCISVAWGIITSSTVGTYTQAASPAITNDFMFVLRGATSVAEIIRGERLDTTNGFVDGTMSGGTSADGNWVFDVQGARFKQSPGSTTKNYHWFGNPPLAYEYEGHDITTSIVSQCDAVVAYGDTPSRDVQMMGLLRSVWDYMRLRVS